MFVIDTDRIIKYADGNTPPYLPDECAGLSDCFKSHADLELIARDQKLGKADLTALYNAMLASDRLLFAGLKEQKAFKNCPYAIAAIWKAAQRLLPTSDPVAPVAESAPVREDGEMAKPKRRTPSKARTTKRDQVIEMMRRKNGATIAQICERVEWAPAAVSGLIQWVLWVSRSGVKSVDVDKNSSGERVYRAA